MRVEPSINVEESTDYSVITLSYSDQWIEEDDIDEDTVAIYRYDEDNGEWVDGEWVDGEWDELVEEGNPSFCNGVEKNTEENYVRANVTKFSTYEIDGEKIQPPEEDGEDTDTGGSGINVPRTSTGVRKLYLSGTNPSRSISQVQENDTINVETETKNQSLTGFNTTAKEYLGTVSVKVNHLGREADKAPEDPNAYSYTKINLKNAEKNEIKNSNLKFKVEKTWLKNKGANPSNVISKIYTEEGWKELNTEVIKETEDFFEFKVVTSEFGMFSFGLKPKIITTKIPDTEIKNQFHSKLINQEFTKIYLGKAATKQAQPTYTKNTMTYKEQTFESNWKEEDYAIIQIEKNKTYIVGTHRHGTRAATIYYKENKPTKTTLIHWKDQNNDQKVQQKEIEKINN